MSDAFEDQARALAHAIPPCDLGSTQGIQAIAIALRETWGLAAQSQRDEVAKLTADCAAWARDYEDRGHSLRYAHESMKMRTEIIDRIWDVLGRPSYEALAGRDIYDCVRELKESADAAEANCALLEQTIQNGAEMIRAAHARTEATEAERDQWKEAARKSGICMSCALGAFEPYGCTDCLNTGWDGGAPAGFVKEAAA